MHHDPERPVPDLSRSFGAQHERVDREDQLTLDTFVALHYRRLVRLAGLVCLDRSEAQDAVQDALLRAWRSRERLRDDERLKPWLDAIVVREAIRTNDRRRTWVRRMLRHVADQPGEAPGVPSGAVLDLLTSLRALPAPQRAAVALHYEAGYSVAEVAELLDVPLETVRSRLRLARSRLRRALAEEAR